MTYEEVNKTIIPSSEIDLKEDFVAIAVSLDNGVAGHCGLAVNHKSKILLFHFDFCEVQLVSIEDLQSKYYLNKISVIRPDEVEYFLAKCELIRDQELEFSWGFLYNGAFFNKEGQLVHQPGEALTNVTNCVFFCITVISGFLISDLYFNFQDWSADRLALNWFRSFSFKSDRHKLTEGQLSDLTSIIRRIPPSDYFSSASIKALPITKASVDQYSEHVRRILMERYTALNIPNALEGAEPPPTEEKTANASNEEEE